jgi:nuclear pore complex protein Nup98-Nup96
MGAVLGIAAFGRTQEKLGGANNGGLQATTAGSPSGFSAPSAPSSGGFGNSGGFGSPAPSSFGGNTGFGAGTSGSYNSGPSWGTTPVSTAPTVVTGFGGKPAPTPAFQPEI